MDCPRSTSPINPVLLDYMLCQTLPTASLFIWFLDLVHTLFACSFYFSKKIYSIITSIVKDPMNFVHWNLEIWMKLCVVVFLKKSFTWAKWEVISCPLCMILNCLTRITLNPDWWVYTQRLKTAWDRCVKGQKTSRKDHRVYNMSEYLLTAPKWIIYKWCEKSI